MNIQSLVNKYIYWPELNNSYQKNIDFSNTTLGEMAPLLKDISKQPRKNITTCIIKFYILNEFLALLRNKENNIIEKEHLELFKEYKKELEIISKDIFAYLFFIVSMEVRHSFDIKNTEQKETLFFDFQNEFYNEQKHLIHEISEEDFLKQADIYADNKINEVRNDTLLEYKSFINNDNQYSIFLKIFELIENISEITQYHRDYINTNILNYLSNDNYKDIKIVDYLEAIMSIYEVNNFDSSYGGKAWVNITEHLLKFCYGEINTEVFIDQTFSLEHNTGQIFNKGVVFTHPKDMTLYIYDSHNDYAKEHYFYDIFLILNLQHQGLLTSFLNMNVKQIHNDTNIFLDSYNNLDEEKEKFILTLKKTNPHLLSNDDKNLKNAVRFLAYNYKSLNNYFEHLKTIDSSLVELLKTINSYKLSYPIMDWEKALNHLKIGKNNLLIESKDKYFINILNLFANNLMENTLKQKPYQFNYYSIYNIEKELINKEKLGNKGLSLVKMAQNKLPVPNAIIFSTENSHTYIYEKEEWVKELKLNLSNILNTLSNKNETLFSIRSGAAISMPGMMDTILNVGIDDTNYDSLCDKMGKTIVHECIFKFIQQFCKSILDINFSEDFEKESLKTILYAFRFELETHNISVSENTLFPLTKEEQIILSLGAIFQSWYSERATAYRNYYNISHDHGTGAIIQQMVFGNLNYKSATGVVFSRNCLTGQHELSGEFLIKAQGEDVVSGSVTPRDIKELESYSPKCYKELKEIAHTLENQNQEIQDIEFTIENDELYILQSRKAIYSKEAQNSLIIDNFLNNKISYDNLIENLDLNCLTPKKQITTPKNYCASGIIANPGVIRGIVIHSENDMKKFSDLYKKYENETDFGWIFVSEETKPEDAPIMLKTDAYITMKGGFTSHAAILARSLNKPCVVGVNNKTPFTPGSLVTIDAHNGNIYDELLPLSYNENLLHQYIKIITEPFNTENIDLKKQEDIEKTWMESYNHQVVIPKKSPNTDKFLDISYKIALYILKEKRISSISLKKM